MGKSLADGERPEANRACAGDLATKPHAGGVGAEAGCARSHADGVGADGTLAASNEGPKPGMAEARARGADASAKARPAGEACTEVGAVEAHVRAAEAGACMPARTACHEVGRAECPEATEVSEGEAHAREEEAGAEVHPAERVCDTKRVFLNTAGEAARAREAGCGGVERVVVERVVVNAVHMVEVSCRVCTGGTCEGCVRVGPAKAWRAMWAQLVVVCVWCECGAGLVAVVVAGLGLVVVEGWMDGFTYRDQWGNNVDRWGNVIDPTVIDPTWSFQGYVRTADGGFRKIPT